MDRMTAEHETARGLLGEDPILFDNTRMISPYLKIRRAAQMWLLYDKHGWSLEKVGRAFDHMTKERVRQILVEHGYKSRPVHGSKAYRDARRVRIAAEEEKAAQEAVPV